MIKKLASTLMILVLAAPAFADVTPMDENIPEEKPTSITCKVPASVKGASTDEYHYVVYLPAGYKANDKREYPVLLIASPGGSASPAMYKARLAKEQMIGIGLTESQNGPVKPIIENFLATIEDAGKRFRIADGFLVATGFSGGARASSGFARLPSFGGLFLQGAGFGSPEIATKNPTVCIYGVFGIGDSNRTEAAGLASGLPNTCIRRFAMQTGTHGWATPEAFDEGMDFILDGIYTRRPNADKNAATQYAIRFRILLARGRAAGGFEKYEAFEWANRIALARKITSDKSLASDKELPKEVAEVAQQLKDLAKDTAVAKELEARTAYYKVRDVEDAKWPASAGQTATLANFAKQCAAGYEAVAKKYPDAIYGKKAADRAAWLSQGVPKDN